MYRTGAVRTLGSVDGKDSHFDHHELEQRRGITIYAKQARISHADVEITLLDTPGHVDFAAEAERVLAALDYALLLIDANDGVRGHTETLWRLLERYDVPTLVFVNKMDAAHRSHEELAEELRQRLSSSCIDFTEVNLASQKRPGDAPFTGEVAEACAAGDESAIEEYLETEALSLATMQRLIAERIVFPCLFGSAIKHDGVDELISAMTELTLAPSQSADFGARVFKVSHDPAGTRLTWLKVTGGAIEAKQPIAQPIEAGREPITQKIDQIRFYTGAKFETAKRAESGQVCAITGLGHTQAGMALGSATETESVNHRNARQPLLIPSFASSVDLNGNDVHKVSEALKLLTDEDPLLNVQWNERLQQLQVQLMGTIQLEIIQATLLERFGLDVTFGPAGVLYRETIEEPVAGIGHFEPLRHYAEVHLLLEPLPAGSGMQFGTCCHVDELDLNWQRLILTNAMEREHSGVLVGAPLTDMRITLTGGRAHDKHTEGGDFRQATYRAIRQGLMRAKNVLLEPWLRFTLRIPADLVGRALSDLQRMSADFEAPQIEETSALITGTAPAREISDYAIRVSSYTHGAGSLSLEFDAYAPCHDADAIIAEAAYDPEADTDNTPDSVFCSHGAGHTVKWSEVEGAAHVKPNPSTFIKWQEATPEFFGQ